MGKSLLDLNTICHFIMGSISFILLDNISIPLVYNLLITNGIHTLIEFNENNKSPDGEILETTKNHTGDIMGFLIGWYVAFYFRIRNHVKVTYIYVLWIILFFCIYKEIYREIYPYSNGIIKGAFT